MSQSLFGIEIEGNSTSQISLDLFSNHNAIETPHEQLMVFLAVEISLKGSLDFPDWPTSFLLGKATIKSFDGSVFSQAGITLGDLSKDKPKLPFVKFHDGNQGHGPWPSDGLIVEFEAYCNYFKMPTFEAAVSMSGLVIVGSKEIWGHIFLPTKIGPEVKTTSVSIVNQNWGNRA